MNNQAQQAQTSIQLIEQTLQRSSLVLERRSAKPLIIWGYTSAIVSLGVWLLVKEVGPIGYWGYFAIPLLGWLISYLGQVEEDKTETSLDRFGKSLWRVIGLGCSLASAALGQFVPFGDKTAVAVLSLNTLLIAVGMLTTGIAYKSLPYSIGGTLGVAGLIFLHLLPLELGFALIALVMMCIPGHCLLLKGHKQGKL